MLHTYRLYITGKVQGVAFRYHLRQKAIELHIKGYTRNLSNGQVEAVLSGLEGDLAKLIKWCHKGPKFAEVTALETEIIAAVDFKDFKILADA